MQNYQVLPLKYRPQSLDEIWIQEHIKTTLKRAIETNRVAHAYLFAGPRGVGKTTTARILAKSLNCVKGPTIHPCQKCSVCNEITNSASLDVLEIDGASNRGIDQVRELRENVKFLPTSCPYKIYIIDEVHMLTPEAFNALLKTLEEPPAHVKFIFATTAPQKVPATIISRCQRFDFRKATVEEIVQRLSWIAKNEGIEISEEALFAIGKRADGAIRDAESMLDQLRVYQTNKINLSDVESLFGIISSDIFFEYTDILIANDKPAIFKFIDKIFIQGYDFNEFFANLLAHFRLLMLTKLNINKKIMSIADNEIKRFETYAPKFSVEKILQILQLIADSEDMIKRTTEPKIFFEILSLNLCNILANQNQEQRCSSEKLPSSNTQQCWQELINEFSERKPALSNILEKAKILEKNHDEILVIFDKEIEKDYVDADKAEIEKCLSLLAKRNIKVNLLCQAKTDGDKTKNPTQRLQNNTQTEDKTQNDNDIDTDSLFQKYFPKSRKLK